LANLAITGGLELQHPGSAAEGKKKISSCATLLAPMSDNADLGDLPQPCRLVLDP